MKVAFVAYLLVVESAPPNFQTTFAARLVHGEGVMALQILHDLAEVEPLRFSRIFPIGFYLLNFEALEIVR